MPPQMVASLVPPFLYDHVLDTYSSSSYPKKAAHECHGCRAPPLIRKTRAQRKLLEAEEDLLKMEAQPRASPQPQTQAEEQKEAASAPASEEPEPPTERQPGAEEVPSAPEPAAEAQPEAEPMQVDTDTMDALDAFSALAGLWFHHSHLASQTYFIACVLYNATVLSNLLSPHAATQYILLCPVILLSSLYCMHFMS